MSRRALAGACLVAAAIALTAAVASAQPPAPAQESVERARQHYATGKSLYLAGKYREALTEFEAAHALDPTAVPLVYDIAVIHEKLGEIDQALRWLRDYLAMNIGPDERAKAETAKRRLEGARKELAQPSASPSATTTATPSAPPTDAATAASGQAPAETPPRSWGRVDAATVLTGVLAVTAFGVGTYFGVRATSDRPNGFVGGVTGTYADFQQRNDNAHREAVVADVALGLGIVATGVTAWLFFGRSSAPAPTAALSIAPRPGGGSVLLGGRF